MLGESSRKTVYCLHDFCGGYMCTGIDRSSIINHLKTFLTMLCCTKCVNIIVDSLCSVSLVCITLKNLEKNIQSLSFTNLWISLQEQTKLGALGVLWIRCFLLLFSWTLPHTIHIPSANAHHIKNLGALLLSTVSKMMPLKPSSLAQNLHPSRPPLPNCLAM